MADAAASAALAKLGELAVSEANTLLQVRDDIILLHDQLEWLQAFIRDADRKRRAGTDGLTRVWVRQTREVAFEAEDAIDDFYDEVLDVKRQGYGRARKILHTYFTCFFTQIVVRHGLSGRIKNIRTRLEQISQNQKGFNLEHTPSAVVSLSSTTAIAAWRDDLENAVGFAKDVEILMPMLRNEKMFFISLIGESGAGKNTLAKIICREMAVATLGAFDVFVWYHMEPGCSTEGLIKHLNTRALDYYGEGVCRRPWENQQYVSLNQSMINRSYVTGMELRGFLYGKKYLLILGGISSKSILNSVRASLPVVEQGSDNGSRVMLILDTENEEIGWHANTMNMNGINGVHVLSRLDQERSGQLFFWKVLRKGQSEEGSTSSDPKDSEYLRQVYQITRGYPMAIVLLAGLLRFKEKPAQWEAVLQQLNSDCQTQEGGSGPQANSYGTRRAMEMIFWASFEDLPDDIKPCFLYLVSYQKSSSHPADDIVRMWISEGFIKQPEDGNTMEELGHDYLKELVLRCLVELEETKANGGIELVRVHKSLMGLMRAEAREIGVMEIHNTDDNHVPPSVRRLCYQSANASLEFTYTFANKKFPKLHSFICHIRKEGRWYDYHDLQFLQWSKLIRVISIQGLKVREFPDVLGDMINLRYLCIDSLLLQQLPSSISRLLNLQTLDIRNTKVNVIDKDFWKIRTLRHVLAEDLILEGVGGIELQTLHGVKADAQIEWTEGNCPLDNVANLRSLQMHGFKYEKHGGTAFRSALKKMHLLGHLQIEGDQIPSYVLTHPNLRSLQTMVLYGSVNWDDVIKELPVVDDRPLRMVRPNLVQLKMNARTIDEIPESISEQLEGILIREA